MRYLWVFFVSLCVSLLSPAVAVAQGGELVNADWGVPAAHVDVTARVRTLIHDGMLQFEVTRFVLGIDPAPHQNKTLVLRVRHWNGQIENYTYPERSTVNLELHNEGGWAENSRRHDDDYNRDADDHHDRREHALVILRADYGAGRSSMNVTDMLQSRIQGGQLQMFVDNYTMGGDPIPGVHKWLRVVYEFDGERRNIVVDEKTNLQLP